MEPRVVTYWEGPQPRWVQLCLESFRRHVPGVEILNAATFHALYDGSLGPWRDIARQRPNVQSDVLRAWFLRKFGGIWIDADCIIFRDPRPIYTAVEHGANAAAYRTRKGFLCSAFLAAGAGSPIMEHYCRMIASRLKRPRPLGFLAIGPLLLRMSVRKIRPPKLHVIPYALIHPEPFWLNRAVYSSAAAYPFHPNAYGFMLTHLAPANLAGLDTAQIMKHPGVIGQAFRRAFPAEV